MAGKRIIHIYWEGPYSLQTLSEMRDENIDYGIYQIYGGHPVYGSDVLLYIGKADRQTFGTRISQEDWCFNRDAGNVQIYVGRLKGTRTPSDEVWSEEIGIAEKLLIFTHKPACNSSNMNSVEHNELDKFHILNWGKYRDLMSEVSGERWTMKHNINEYKYYRQK